MNLAKSLNRVMFDIFSFHKSQRRNYKQDAYWYIAMWPNRFSKDKVTKLGPDRACAEWLVRCAADVRIKGRTDFFKTISECRSVEKDKEFLIEEIDATHSCIAVKGFNYFEGIKNLKILKLINCNWIDDECISKLAKHCGQTIEHLEICSSGFVSNSGILYLQNCKSLKFLHLSDLPFIDEKDMNVVFDALRFSLGNRCKFVYTFKPRQMIETK